MMFRRSYKLAQDILAVMYVLDTNPCAVLTPHSIANKSGVKYERVIQCLNAVHRVQQYNPGTQKILGSTGSQYQTYHWSIVRCKPRQSVTVHPLLE